MKKLVLVDYENVTRVNFSILDASYEGIIFVGAKQNPPKAVKRKESAHRFTRVTFQKIEGTGKNALDFHIAFHLGRVIERSPATKCFILSKDTGFDPLVSHLNKSGLTCSRITDLMDLVELPTFLDNEHSAGPLCGRCLRPGTIEHLGGRWCAYCGDFSVPPKAELRLRASKVVRRDWQPASASKNATCGICNRRMDMSDGIYDDGEWLCGSCISSYVQET